MNLTIHELLSLYGYDCQSKPSNPQIKLTNMADKNQTLHLDTITFETHELGAILCLSEQIQAS